MLDIVATAILESAAEGAVGVLEDALKRENAELVKQHQRRLKAKFVATSSITQESLRRHIEQTQRWSSTVNFSDLQEKKSISRIYVELDTYLLPLNRHESRDERKQVKALLPALHATPDHCAILGGPGAGKTTSLKKVAADFFVKGKVLLNYNFPILIRLRDIVDSNSKFPLYDRIQEILSLKVEFPDADIEIPLSIKEGIAARAIESYLDGLRACILLDGFDEISSTLTKSAVLQNIESLAERLSATKLIVTSRVREFSYSGEGIQRFEIAPLSEPQISLFAQRWLASESLAADFLGKVRSSPFADTTIRPLTIAHLCAIYERIQDIPDKPKNVYKRVVNLLLKEWDEQRSVKRKSAYSGFDVDRKMDFLAQLSFELTTTVKSLQFDSYTLKHIYSNIHRDHGLPATDCENVVLEIESHNGLFLQSGFDNYEFAHKSLQEFLAADYIVRLPSLSRISSLYDLLPNELAIATSLSSKSGDYLCELMLRAFDYKSLSPTWYSVFANRLISEKAELTIGHSAFTIIASLFLASNLEEPEKYSEVLLPLIPSDARRQLDRYYRISQPLDGAVFLTRLAKHQHFSLPQSLRVPAALLP